jgi:hypothetical protein
MRFRLRHRRALYASACAAVAVLASAAAAAPAAASAGGAPALLSRAPLGLNTAPWDYIYAANTSKSSSWLAATHALLQARLSTSRTI